MVLTCIITLISKENHVDLRLWTIGVALFPIIKENGGNICTTLKKKPIALRMVLISKESKMEAMIEIN